MKKVLIAMPDDMVKLIDARAKTEFRTRSDMIRQMIRDYLKLTLVPVPVQNPTVLPPLKPIPPVTCQQPMTQRVVDVLDNSVVPLKDSFGEFFSQ